MQYRADVPGRRIRPTAEPATRGIGRVPRNNPALYTVTSTATALNASHAQRHRLPDSASAPATVMPNAVPLGMAASNHVRRVGVTSWSMASEYGVHANPELAPATTSPANRNAGRSASATMVVPTAADTPAAMTNGLGPTRSASRPTTVNASTHPR